MTFLLISLRYTEIVFIIDTTPNEFDQGDTRPTAPCSLLILPAFFFDNSEELVRFDFALSSICSDSVTRVLALTRVFHDLIALPCVSFDSSEAGKCRKCGR